MSTSGRSRASCEPPLDLNRNPNARLPNQRMKLSARGGRAIGNNVFLSAAAAGRSLCAIR